MEVIRGQQKGKSIHNIIGLLLVSHVENSRLVEFSFGAESLFKLFNMFITSTYELTFMYGGVLLLIQINIVTLEMQVGDDLSAW